MRREDLAAIATIMSRPKRVDVPQSFLGFCSWLGVELTPGQAEFARVAYDGLEPVDRDLAVQIFGPDLPVGRRRVVAAVCGRRAGKSYVMVALRLVHGMLVRVPPLPPGIKAVAMIIAPRSNMRDDGVRVRAWRHREQAGVARNARIAEGRDVHAPTSGRQAGHLRVRRCHRWRYGCAWSMVLDFALDECAFFRDNTFKVNDEELYKAGRSVLLPGGQILITSTPWAETGSLYRMWKTRPDNAHVAHAPTLVANDNHITREIVHEAEEEDRTQRRASSALAL